MRVFCPVHKRGFLAPRQSPIKCENRAHILGGLDFEGEAKRPVELRWQYCCNCEHFCPIDFDRDGLERCPVCTRPSSTLYLCDRCYTISFESNTPIQTKNFTLTSEGAPQPSCPGCLHSTSADLREHTCDELGASFTTALGSCPICQERLDIGPSFPSSVAHYLKRTKAANKLNVTFDYENELFVPVEDGEFVVIRNGNEIVEAIVLPRSARFETRRDFYEFYQDYYHCPNPSAGEVHIVQPAAAARVAGGWKLQTPGILEVLEDHPRKKVAADVPPPPSSTSAREEAGPLIAAMKDESPVTRCTHCDSLVETRYAFCWKCGNPLTPENEPSVTRFEEPKTTMPSAAIATEDDELTAQHQVVPAGSPMFSWALAKEPNRPTSANGALLKLVAVAVVGLVLVSIGIFVLMRSSSRMGSSTAALAVPQNPQGNPGLTPGREVEPNPATEPGALSTPAARTVDDDLKKLRERRIAAGASNRSAIFQAFAATEKQYPNDYRFPYERAKLAIKGQQTSSDDEAFAALSLAAKKAINTGKAREMLDSLVADKRRDFYKLSHVHREWTQLEEALKKKDKRLLSADARNSTRTGSAQKSGR
jgi:hypothetical protein